jgi:S1-C subfamily serine protease
MNVSNRLFRVLASGALPLAALLALSVCAAAQQKKPITKTGLLAALQHGGLTATEMVREIQRYGVDFQLTPQIEAELRRAGATPAVLRAVGVNYRSSNTTPSPVNTPTPRVPVKAPEPAPPPIRIGAVVQDLTPTSAGALGLAPRGVLVSTVEVGGLAERAGLARRDVITALNDAPVGDMNDLLRQLARIHAPAAFTLTVARDGATTRLNVGGDASVAKRETLALEPGAPGVELKAAGGRLGLRAAPPTAELSSRFHLTNAKGLIVTFADVTAPAGAAGIKPGDVIEKINGKDVRTQEDAEKALSKTESGRVRLRVRRGDDSFNVDLLPRT